MRYYIDEERYAAQVKEKFVAYRAEAGRRFAEVNKYTAPDFELSLQEQESLARLSAGEFTMEQLEPSLQEKAVIISKEMQDVDKKITSNEYTPFLFTLEELKDYITIDLKDIINGQEEEHISESRSEAS